MLVASRLIQILVVYAGLNYILCILLAENAALAGFAIADVNYGGSTGYGREYRNRLRRNWGIVDVADCSNAAKHLAKQGKADEKRLCIDGGSAGGYTTLACLAFRSDCLQSGLCACLAFM